MACHKGSAAGQEESKRPRDGNEEEEELLTELSRYRRYWTDLWSDDSGDVEKRTEIGPMRYTEDPPRFAMFLDLLEVFSFEVTELKGILRWPLDVFGLISVRDSLDRTATISLSAPGTTARLSLQRIHLWFSLVQAVQSY